MRQAKKGICKTDEMAEFPARYHVGRMLEMIPRFFAVQSGKKSDGSPDFGWWFENQGLDAMADMARGEFDKLRQRDESQKDCARSSIIFSIKDFLYERNKDLEDMDPINKRFFARKKL